MSSNNKEMVSELFAQHGRDLLGYLRSRLGSQEAEDVVQKTYLQLLRHTNLQEILNPVAYLFRAATNLAIDHVRKQRVETNHFQTDIDLDAFSSPCPSPETSVETSQLLAQVRDALADLPPLCRHAFILNRVDRLTHAEISAKLGISKKSVERYIIKASEKCYKNLLGSKS